MKLLDRVRTVFLDTEPDETPNTSRHSEAGVIHRLREEIDQLRRGYNPEIQGYKDALQEAAEKLWVAEQEAARFKDLFGKADRGWRAAHAEVLRQRVLLSADAGLPGTAPVAAPIEQGCRDTPSANAETQAVDVRDLRKAMKVDDTQTLPAVTPVVPVGAPMPRLTWGVKTGDEQPLTDWANGTAPREAGPTEVSALTGALASHKVHLATTASTTD